MMQVPEEMRCWWAQSLIAVGVLVVLYGLGDGDWRWPAVAAPILVAEIGLRAVFARRRNSSTAEAYEA